VKVFFRICLSVLLFTKTISAYAYGEVTGNVMSLAHNVGSIASGVCLILGIALFLGALVQYKQHRRNKLQTPISKPIVLAILGIVLVLVPMLGQHTIGGALLQ
jgi:hypothetical protein